MRDQTESRKMNRIEGVKGVLNALHGWMVQVSGSSRPCDSITLKRVGLFWAKGVPLRIDAEVDGEGFWH